MLTALSFVLLVAAVVGSLCLLVIALCVGRHGREAPRQPRIPLPPVSILKPLCGVDEDLEANLAAFAELDYPAYEVVLGVRDAQDPAFAAARAATVRWPQRMRLVLQEGEPGLNPKVNQLITLARAARHDLLLISDSNARAAPGFLREIAAHFEDDDTGCVSNPVVGAGERSLGALLDNLHLSSSVGPGQIAARRIGRRDLPVGKSMALRRQDLEALGGFGAFKDFLAEDYALGQAVRARLGKRVVIAAAPVFNLSRHRTVGSFFQRYVRWSVIHRTAISLPTYLAQALLNPAPLAWLAVAAQSSARVIQVAAAVTLVKALVDWSTASMLRGAPFRASSLLAVPLKDALLFAAWLNGLFCRTVEWRGNRLRVARGSRLVDVGPARPAAPSVTGGHLEADRRTLLSTRDAPNALARRAPRGVPRPGLRRQVDTSAGPRAR